MGQATSSLSTILKAFFVSSMGTGLSRVLGTVRDIVISHYFGASKVTDAFWIAYTIPSTFRRFVADEGLTGALIPAISQEEKQYGTDAAHLLTDIIFTLLLCGLLLICMGGIIGAPYLVHVFAHGFSRDPETFNLTVRLTQWLFPFVAMVSLVSFSEGILNYRGHFFIPKIAPGIISAGAIACVFLFFNSCSQPIYSLALGFLVGGTLHLLIQIFPLYKFWFIPRIRFSPNHPRVKAFLVEMGKVFVIGIFAQLNLIVLRNLASYLSPGSVTHYWNANRIMDLAQGMIAIGMASAIMPALAISVAEKAWDRMRDQLEYSLQLVAFFLIPTAIFILFFSLPIVSILFRHGNFTFTDAKITAVTLQCLVPFLLNVAGINIIKKVYFAFDDRNTLLVIGGIGVVVTAGIGSVLIHTFGVKGLAIALSVSSFLQIIVYLFRLNDHIKKIMQPFQLLGNWFKMVLACLPMAIILYFCNLMGNWEQGIGGSFNGVIFLFAFVCSLITYCVMAYFFKLSELHILLKIFRKHKSKNT